MFHIYIYSGSTLKLNKCRTLLLGTPNAIRTRDSDIKSIVLYQLSYEGINGPGGGTRTRTSMIKSQPYCQLILRPDIRFRSLSERFRLYLFIVVFLFRLIVKWYLLRELNPRLTD